MLRCLNMIVLLVAMTGPAVSQTDTGSDVGRGKEIRLYEGEEIINLSLQQAELIRISQSADVMVVGDPEIADATLVSDRTLLLTPKSVGSTNVFVLDANGTIILEAKMVVQEEGVRYIKVRRGSSSTTYLCRDSTGCTAVENTSEAAE